MFFKERCRSAKSGKTYYFQRFYVKESTIVDVPNRPHLAMLVMVRYSDFSALSIPPIIPFQPEIFMKIQPSFIYAICATLLIGASGIAAAADSQVLAVTANVPGLCKFSSTSTPLAFGSVDPSLTADKVVPVNVNYKCTKNTTSLGVTAAGGTSRTLVGPTAADTMGYTLSFSGGTQAGKGFGPGQDLVLVVTGTITAAQYQNAAAGAYSENVTLNITP